MGLKDRPLETALQGRDKEKTSESLCSGEFSDEVFFYQNVKGGQHNFINLIPKHTRDPSVWLVFVFLDLLPWADPGDGHPQHSGVQLKAL